MARPTACHLVPISKHVLNSKVEVECSVEISEELLEVGSAANFSARSGGIEEDDGGGEQFVYRCNVALVNYLLNMMACNGHRLVC